MPAFAPLTSASFSEPFSASIVFTWKIVASFAFGFTFTIRATCHAAWFAITEASQKVASSINSEANISNSGARKANST